MFRPILVKDMQQAGVPRGLQRAVHVLNEALFIDRKAVKVCLDDAYELSPAESDAFTAHSSIIVRSQNGERLCSITGLGLLAGCVNEGPFRLSVREEDDGSWTAFGAVEVVPDAPEGAKS